MLSVKKTKGSQDGNILDAGRLGDSFSFKK